MSQMRKKRKLRGRAAAAEAIAAEHELPEVQEALEGEALARAAEAADIQIDDDAEADESVEAEADEAQAAEAAGDEPEAAAAGEGGEPGSAADDEQAAFDLKRTVESLVFASDKPITAAQIAQLLGRAAERKQVTAALAELAEDYRERGIVLHDVAGGYQFRTHPASSAYVQRLVAGKPVRLSRAQLDTLAIIAYRQPITRPEIDEIRGVDSGGTLKVLLDRQLIRVLGKKEEPGRPLLYGTTKDFLEFFNLSDLRELPTLREFHELTEDSVREAQRLGVDLGPQGGAQASEAEAGEAEATQAEDGGEAEASEADAGESVAEASEMEAGEAEASEMEAGEAEGAEQAVAEDADAEDEVDAVAAGDVEADAGADTAADEVVDETEVAAAGDAEADAGADTAADEVLDETEVEAAEDAADEPEVAAVADEGADAAAGEPEENGRVAAEDDVAADEAEDNAEGVAAAEVAPPPPADSEEPEPGSQSL